MATRRQPITWKNERRKLSALIPWEENPRQIQKAEAERLEQSLSEFGQIQTIAIDKSQNILDGHQRQLVWSAAQKYGPDFEVDVRVSSRQLTTKERQKLVVLLHKGAAGEWDWDKLANTFDMDDLETWGLSCITKTETDEAKEQKAKKDYEDSVLIKIFVVGPEDWIKNRNEIANFLSEKQIKYEIIE